jgi:DHA1 family tetracycline resistance protein-like MFS transporter
MPAVAKVLFMLFAARIVDGLSGGNITTARAYIADITTEENRAKGYGLLGAAFGLGFIVGPALGAAFSHISYTAPIWAAALITVVATALAVCWLPETVHVADAGGRARWRAVVESWHLPHLRVLFTIDFMYWAAFAVYQTTFALFGARRFAFDAAHTGYLLSIFGFLGVVVQGGMVGPVVKSLGERRTLSLGLACAAIGWGGSALTYSLPVFMRCSPGAVGIGLCNATLSSLIKSASPRAGRVQGRGSARESGRTVGPVWGNGTLQRFGEEPHGPAAIVLIGAAAHDRVSRAGDGAPTQNLAEPGRTQ